MILKNKKYLKSKILLFFITLLLSFFIFNHYNSTADEYGEYVDYSKLPGTYCTYDPKKYSKNNIYFVLDGEGNFILYEQFNILCEGTYVHNISERTITLNSSCYVTYNNDYHNLTLKNVENTVEFTKYSDVLLYINVPDRTITSD